ncbi:SPFH domain-containing protein [Polyangium sp. y55x31]|uniref:SPFH domain-containing protein n=1 Tax=Polyangium sp. y55x31 TaxID=3042688 RepID=UPI002483034D|nr:SPFH domain-containing protein [Polyangium sp. y55x31]MDI1478780.1 SPFH domain-containing protein [Polyangium sp. y55x31]
MGSGPAESGFRVTWQGVRPAGSRAESRELDMGIMDFVKGGVREMMIARPDRFKNLIVYKHPDQNIPFWSQLTVDSDECALFFKDGKYMGYLPPGRHTLQTQNIPFLNNLINSFTGGDVFIAEIYFVKMQPIRSVPFGGPLESMEDPILYEFVTPRIFGEFSLVVTDPVRFVIGYHGQAAGAQDNDVILNWIKGLFFMSVKTVIGQMCAQQGKSLLNLGGMSMEIAGRIQQSAPNLDEIGVKILQIGNFNINFAADDQKRLTEANKARAEARRGVGIAADTARAQQFQLDQKFQQDARYVQHLAGSPAWNNYAAGQAMMGAGEGMAKGGGNTGVAQLGAQAAIGMGMAQNMMQPHFQQPQYAQQQPPQPQQAPGGGQSVEARLQKLAALKQQGLISDEDFNARKAKILEEI